MTEKMTGIIKAICKSERRGVTKAPVGSAYFREDWGVEGDAHGGTRHRQVSILNAEKIADFNEKGASVSPGAFGENLIIEGIDVTSLPICSRLRCGDVLLEISQFGKVCHSHCEIYDRMGDCIMPREGVFARVLKSGDITVGDEVFVETASIQRPWRCAVVTLSDSASQGIRADESGPLISARLRDGGYDIVEEVLLPDNRAALENTLIFLCDALRLDLIITTGGTGFSPSDVTPEATLAVAERHAPGIAEAIRAASMKITPHAMLSRAVSVIRRSTLIINLPGSPKACRECMDVFIDVLPHAISLLRREGKVLKY